MAKSERKVFEGRVCVYRDSYMRDFLSAEFESLDGQTHIVWDRAPEKFVDLIPSAIENYANFRFTAGPDGKNPRKIELM